MKLQHCSKAKLLALRFTAFRWGSLFLVNAAECALWVPLASRPRSEILGKSHGGCSGSGEPRDDSMTIGTTFR